MLWVAGNCSQPKKLCWSRGHACLPTGTFLSIVRNGKTKHDQLVKESTALGNLLLQAEKIAPQLRTQWITTVPKQVVQRAYA